MSDKITKSKGKDYFQSPKKERLARKMIFDANQVNIPSSCYELRPINENESNDDDIIFEPKSSSLKEISEFQKNSPLELDKIIYGHGDQNFNHATMFMTAEKQIHYLNEADKSDQSHEIFNQASNHLKRENPLPNNQEIKKYENIVKIFQVVKQPCAQDKKIIRVVRAKKQEKPDQLFKVKEEHADQIEGIEHQIFNRKKLNFKKYGKYQVESQNFNSASDSNYSSFLERQRGESKRKNKGGPTIQRPKNNVLKQKPKRKVTQNTEHELINTYVELLSYCSLIEDLITVYDQSPLFQNPIDFESDEETTQTKNIAYISRGQKAAQYSRNQVKIEQNSMEMEDVIDCKNEKSSYNEQKPGQKGKKQMFSLLQRMKIQQCPEQGRKRLLKQMKFQKTKTFYHFYDAITQLKPYVKKINFEQKTLFLQLKKELKQIKQILEYFDRQKLSSDKKQHVCKICGEEFESGRQLGGHMSRKHPGKAFEYGFKKELHKIKEIERNRRKYFKTQRVEVKIEHFEEQKGEY